MLKRLSLRLYRAAFKALQGNGSVTTRELLKTGWCRFLLVTDISYSTMLSVQGHIGPHGFNLVVRPIRGRLVVTLDRDVYGVVHSFWRDLSAEQKAEIRLARS